MLQSMGRPAADPQAVDDMAQKVREQFIQLETGLQGFMKQVGNLINQYPAFGQKSGQAIGEAIESIHGALNEGMLTSIQQLGQQEPAAPPTGY